MTRDMRKPLTKHNAPLTKNAAAVQKNVIDDITRLTGMAIVRVDVVVMDLEDDADASDDEENAGADSDTLSALPLN